MVIKTYNKKGKLVSAKLTKEEQSILALKNIKMARDRCLDEATKIAQETGQYGSDTGRT